MTPQLRGSGLILHWAYPIWWNGKRFCVVECLVTDNCLIFGTLLFKEWFVIWSKVNAKFSQCKSNKILIRCHTPRLAFKRHFFPSRGGQSSEGTFIRQNVRSGRNFSPMIWFFLLSCTKKENFGKEYIFQVINSQVQLRKIKLYP